MKTAKLILVLLSINLSSGCVRDNGSAASNEKRKEIRENSIPGKRDAEVTSPESGKTNYTSSGEKSGMKIISSLEVKLHIGDSLTIRGYVADIYLSDKVAYINFENKFPKNIFSCAVFESRFNDFGDLSKYKDKTVEVTGKITTYKNKPQVILNSKDQIRIMTNEK